MAITLYGTPTGIVQTELVNVGGLTRFPAVTVTVICSVGTTSVGPVQGLTVLADAFIARENTNLPLNPDPSGLATLPDKVDCACATAHASIITISKSLFITVSAL
jgi:hypothetical protein